MSSLERQVVVVVKEMLLQVSYKQRLLLAPSRWLRTTHLTHL
eukprot:COSAG02_NODE_9418_length_2222_cov_29.435704_3_plen_41_part_01